MTALQLNSDATRGFAFVSHHHLSLGEGNFSHSAARIRKYGPHALIATELDDRYTIGSRSARDEATLSASLRLLESSPGASVLFGVDATLIDQDPRLHSAWPLLTRYPRISFHMPFVSKGASTTQRLVAGFFDAASRVQAVGDRVEMALVDDAFYRDKVYHVRTASSEAGYELRRRLPMLQRFQAFGYVHSVSTGNRPSHSAEHALVYRFRKRFQAQPASGRDPVLAMSCPRAQLMCGIFDLVHQERMDGYDDATDTSSDSEADEWESESQSDLRSCS